MLTQNHGLSPLTIVSLHGFVEVVVVLLEHGAAVNPAPVCGCYLCRLFAVTCLAP